ncbi:MAG: DNA polymerase III subunit delta, partial [Alistipes sp.]|nr:DNA polymerase III subunit delta [Alistipes sp.]
RDYEMKDWLRGFIEQRGMSMERKGVDMIVDHVGTDISKISNELDKLIISLPEGTKQITDSIIEERVGISKEFNNFELCNAVATFDVARSLRIADHMSRNPKEYPLLLTISTLFGLFRDMFIVNYLRWQTKRKGIAFPDNMELMRTLKKSNVYAVEEIKQQSARWENRRVFNILGLLREYDGKSKGIDAGAADEGELRRELLLKIFMQ